MNNSEKLLVTIHCLAYNHEPYIRECLEGFVMQKTNFRFVAIVHDDASTDKTADIIREYEAKYPDIIKPIYEAENQYSKRDGTIDRTMDEAIAATGAKYVAMCEGDDYWTDPLKLQKQVDFLEEHEEYSFVCTRYIKYWQLTGKFEHNDNFDFLFPNSEVGVPFTINAFPWIPQILTVMFRKDIYLSILNETYFPKLKFHYDVPMFYVLLRNSNGYIFNYESGVCRKHEGGVYSGLKNYQLSQRAFEVYYDIYHYDKSEIIFDLAKDTLNSYMYTYVKYSSQLSVSTFIDLFHKQRELGINGRKRIKSFVRLFRAYSVRVIKRTYKC